MTDHRNDNDPHDWVDLTPAQTESVRRLLAEARATGPIPPDVRARLDDVLGELKAGALDSVASAAIDPPVTDSSPSAKVIDLSARRRAKVGKLLVAAAAVVAIGVAIPQVLPGGLTSNQDAASTATSDSGDESALDAGTDNMPRQELEETAPRASEPSAATPRLANKSVQGTSKDAPRVRARAFAADATSIRDQFGRDAPTAAESGDETTCLIGGDFDASASIQIPVRFRKLDALLVLDPVAKGSQRASLYVCGESTPRQTTLLEAR